MRTSDIFENYNEIAAYNVLGLRSLCPDENYSIGDYARNSLDWDAENDCSSENELPGTSTILIDNDFLENADDLIERIGDILPAMEQYHGGRVVVLLGGWESSQGTDEGERVIVNAKVLAIL